MKCCSRHGLRTRFQVTIIMQISVLFAYCSGRNFNDTDPFLLSKYGTRQILGSGIGPRDNEYLMRSRRIVHC